MDKIKKLSLNLMSFVYFAAGVNHFVQPPFYIKMMPPYLPAHGFLVAASGVAEMALGLLLLNRYTRSLAAWGVILLLIAVFPANVYMYQQGGAAFGVPDWILTLRLPLQLLLVLWAYWHTKNPELDQKTIETQIVINADAAKVWRVFSNFADYKSWNPFIIAAEGTFQPKTKSDITHNPPGGVPIKFRNTIIENIPGKKLSWRGTFLWGGIFDGLHTFEIRALSDHETQFIQKEYFSGVAIPMAGEILSNTEKGFTLMNECLKAKCESQS